MTETEVTLFKELIRETVRSVLKEEKFNVTEEVKKTFAKDLKEIKLLIAKQIKENRERPANQIIESKVAPGKTGAALSEERQAALKKILGGMGMPISAPPSAAQSIKSIKESKMDSTTKNILLQTAMSMTEEDAENLGTIGEVEEEIPAENYNYTEEVEDEYQPKFSSNIPNFPR